MLDATEEGDLLPLAGCELVVGAESAADTGEPHALDGPADPADQQAITWCAALEWRPGEDHTVDRPAGYDFWRGYRADFWPGPQLGWATEEPETGRPLRRPLFGAAGEQDLWTFRRIRYGGHYVDPVPDVTLVNWPQVDYWLAPLVGVTPADQRADALAAARELTLSFVHWLQTEAPRPDGGTGYPGLRLCPEVLGTADGLAAAAYVRESRRIAAEFTVLESHVGVEARPGADRAAAFADTVGVGCYRIDLHPSTAGRPLPRHRHLPVPDPARRAAPAAPGQPGRRREVPGRHPHHQRLLPAPPGGVERRRGGRRARRVLPRPPGQPAGRPRHSRPARRLPAGPCAGWASSCPGRRRSRPRSADHRRSAAGRAG